MSEEMRVANGDRVELYSKDKNTYRAIVSEVTDNNLLYVTVPTLRSVLMQIDVGDEIYLTFFREKGRYVVRTSAKELLDIDGIKHVSLEQLSEPEIRQQREFYRLPVRLKTVVYKIIQGGDAATGDHSEVHDEAEVVEFETAETKDLSVAGVGIESSREYNKGEKYQLRIYLNFSKDDVRQVLTFVDVMRAEMNEESKMYKVGMRFFGLTADTMSELSKFVIKAQQQQIVRKRMQGR